MSPTPRPNSLSVGEPERGAPTFPLSTRTLDRAGVLKKTIQSLQSHIHSEPASPPAKLVNLTGLRGSDCIIYRPIRLIADNEVLNQTENSCDGRSPHAKHCKFEIKITRPARSPGNFRFDPNSQLPLYHSAYLNAGNNTREP